MIMVALAHARVSAIGLLESEVVFQGILSIMIQCQFLLDSIQEMLGGASIGTKVCP